MIKSILVSVDASPSSNRAVNMAGDLAAKYGAKLHILHVVRDMQLPPQIRRMAEVEKLMGPRQDVLNFVASKILSDAETRAKKHGAEKLETINGSGDPATCIISQAKRKKVDLIVLGTRGLGKVKGMVLGSVSRKVANLTDISCLIIR